MRDFKSGVNPKHGCPGSILVKIFSVSDRLAAKIFVFVISCFLSLEFRVTRNQNLANILTIL